VAVNDFLPAEAAVQAIKHSMYAYFLLLSQSKIKSKTIKINNDDDEITFYNK
jgi:hypothetical protein